MFFQVTGWKPVLLSFTSMTARDKAADLVRVLQEKGFTAYFAGGCVRDSLRKSEPEDYDIATDATPERVRECFPKSFPIGAHFGVILVRKGDEDFQIATFRSDGAYLDGRHPDKVTFSSPEEDARRRDFTINGMFYDPVAEEVIDFVGGQKDLEAGIIRAIGDAHTRFHEDHLRILRAIRFATTLELEIESGTWSALCEEAPNIRRISVERTRDELVKILLSPHRLRGFDLLVESGLAEILLPEIMEMRGCEQPPQFHPEGDVFVHTRIMLGLLPAEASLPLILSALLHDVGKPPTYSFDTENQRIRFNNHDTVGAQMSEEILRRLKFSNETINAVAEAVAKHMIFKDVQKMRVAKLKRFMARPTFQDELELHRVDCKSSHGMLDNYEFLREKAEEFANEPLIPPRLVTGDDLKAMGWKPSPQMGRILKEVQNLQLEGKLTEREEAFQWIRKNFSVPAE